ncbi:MAG: YbbR-like domain-containing protein [Fimbriimonas sp.]
MEATKLNWPLAIASLVMSLLIWTWVYLQNLNMDTRTFGARVVVERLPEKMVITKMPATLEVRASGSKTKLAQIDPAQIQAVVSLTNATPGRRSYKVTLYPVHYQEFFADQTYTVPIEIEPIATRKMTVEAETVGQLSDPAIVLDEIMIDPETVTVTGPKSVVEQLAKARARFDLSPIGLTTNSAQSPGVELLLPNGTVPRDVKLEVEPMLVTMQALINAAPQQKLVFINPNIQGSPPEGFMSAGYELIPNQVTLRGPSRIVAAVTQIMTDPVSLSGVKETRDFTVNLRVPQGLTVDKRRITVRVIVKLIPTTAGTPPKGP